MQPEAKAKKLEKLHRQMQAYSRRDEILREMGFASYRSYLASDLWAGIRRQVLARDQHKCFAACGRKAKHVHHTRYTFAVLRGEDLSGLVSVCAGCHKGAEFSRKHGKATINQANRSLRRRRKRAAAEECWKSDARFKHLWHDRKAVMKMPKDSIERRTRLIEIARERRQIIRAKAREL